MYILMSRGQFWFIEPPEQVLGDCCQHFSLSAGHVLTHGCHERGRDCSFAYEYIQWILSTTKMMMIMKMLLVLGECIIKGSRLPSHSFFAKTLKD